MTGLPSVPTKGTTVTSRLPDHGAGTHTDGGGGGQLMLHRLRHCLLGRARFRVPTIRFMKSLPGLQPQRSSTAIYVKPHTVSRWGDAPIPHTTQRTQFLPGDSRAADSLVPAFVATLSNSCHSLPRPAKDRRGAIRRHLAAGAHDWRVTNSGVNSPSPGNTWWP